jgi:predicted DNA-binding transcriptional regulator YafY
MARSQKQKLKLLYLMQYLTQHSDEAHPVGIAQMAEMLAERGILAERKSLYADLEALREFGLDVVQTRGKTVGYYIGTRDFELPELKLLVDSVQSSKFITQRKTLALIRKIESLASVHDAAALQRQVYVRNRVKSMNESVYYNVDEISSAIAADKKIRFLYFEYTVKKERRYRHDGAYYELSPYALMWDDENYYLLAYDAASASIRHYRVDKMAQITTLESFRDGREAFAKVDMSAYSKKVFGMFAGEAETVRLRFADHLAGAVIDRFGRDVMLIREDDEHFSVSIEAVVSPQFYAWVFGFGTEAEVLSPAKVREGMAEMARDVLKQYGKD